MRCKVCSDTGTDALGNRCTACSKGMERLFTVSPWIPAQYQGNKYSASALPLTMNAWATDMEAIRDAIIEREDRRNYLICSPYRSGKTVWSYDLLESLACKGYPVTPIVDLLDIRRMSYSFKEDDMNKIAQIYGVPVLIVRIPPIVQSGIVETMQTVLYKRVSVNGQTIFLYADSYYNLAEASGKKELLHSILGDGMLGSVRLKDYRRNKDGELQN